MDPIHQRRHYLIPRSILMAGILLVCCSSAFALNPALDVSQYAHTSWKIRDGFAKGRISSIAQTPDGYLWLGTDFGLLRFDGVRNVAWKPPADQPLPSNGIIRLLSTHDGTLWIGTDKGLASWNGNRLTKYPEVAGQFVFALLEDRDGSVWVGTFSPATGRLCTIHNGGAAQCFGADGSFGNGVFSLHEDKKGNLWAASEHGVWRWKPGPPELFDVPGLWLGTEELVEDSDGALLICTDVGIKRLINGKTEDYVGLSPRLRASKIFRDNDGALWIGTSRAGLVHVHEGRMDLFSSSDGLTSEDVGSIFEDREGSIWVTTNNGLDRFHELVVPTFSAKQGLSNTVMSLLAVRDGSVLIAAITGMNRWNKGQFSTYGKGTAAPQQDNNPLLSLFQDTRGRIWGVTKSAFGYLENERFISIPGVPGGVARSIVEDKRGDLWIANEHVGLFHLRGSEIVEMIPWDKLGRKDFATALAIDPVEDGLWLGFFQGGVAYYENGQVRSTYGSGDGLGEGFVNDFQFDKNGTLWIATAGGLSRLKAKRLATLSSRNGLPCDTIHWFREDDDHFFWLYTACGLVRIARSELDNWSAAVDRNREQFIRATVLDISDGVRSRIYPSGYSPQVAKSQDGKLWFPSDDGVSVLDPHHLPFNQLPPPVRIEQITADHKTYEVASDASERLGLPALTHDLQIDYTALSLIAPEKSQFRYKLEGYDSDWQDASNRRQAFYTNLPPRSYRFRVMASNNSGVWNETGAFLDFNIAPAYYQTTWFRLLVVVGLALALAALYQLRLRHLATIYKGRMEERVHERERIARDLHDTFLQSVQGLILKFDAVARQIPRDQPARMAMESALDRADEVMAEGRERVRNLRDTTVSIGNLPEAFARVAEEVSDNRGATFKTVVEGRVRNLNHLVLEESYAIGREAIINAFTHSGGRQIEAEITYDGQQFRLRVRDDGRGIDGDILNAGKRSDHYGLPGMQERARRIQGQLNLWSGADRGTEVELIVPAKTAYQTTNSKPKQPWFGRTK